MWPLTPQERQAALFAVLVLLAGISLKLVFHVAPLAAGSLSVLDNVVYRPKVDINKAGYAELLTVPHVGPAAAARIMNYRQAHGRFRSSDELALALKRKPDAVRRLSGYFQWP